MPFAVPTLIMDEYLEYTGTFSDQEDKCRKATEIGHFMKMETQKATEYFEKLFKFISNPRSALLKQTQAL